MMPPSSRKRRLRSALIPTLLLAITIAAFFYLLRDTRAADRAEDAALRVKPDLEKALAKKNLGLGAPVFLRIFKESSELEVWMQKEPAAVERDEPDAEPPPASAPSFALFRTYKICKWSGTLGPKEKQGDGQAPEGFYFVTSGRMNPHSSFHLAFDLGYPNAYDRALKRTGNYLMVHGNCVSIGCYAMTDKRIEEIYTLVDAALNGGQKYFRVHCFPFRMSDERMKKAAKNDDEKVWLKFWENLREGYDWFEEKKTPPDVEIEENRYVFSE